MDGDLTWFKFRSRWIKVFKTLSKPEMDRLLDAIDAYTNGRELPDMVGREAVAWAFIESELEDDKNSRRKAVEAHQKAGAKGGRLKTKDNQMVSEETKQNQLVITKTKDNQTDTELRDKELRVKENKSEEVKSIESVNSAEAQKTSKPKPEKHKHGSFQNVLLTDAELEKLHERFSDAEQRIESFSVKKAAKGYVYKSDYAAILAWAGNDGKKQQQITQPEPKRTYTFSEVYEMQQRGEL